MSGVGVGPSGPVRGQSVSRQGVYQTRSSPKAVAQAQKNWLDFEELTVRPATSFDPDAPAATFPDDALKVVMRSDQIDRWPKTRRTEVANMNGNRYYGVRVEGAKYGVSFGTALAIAISYTANHSILWAIVHGILGWLYVIYYALFRS